MDGFRIPEGTKIRLVNCATPGVEPHDQLEDRARRLWPDGEPHAEHNRAAWLRAVRSLRAGGGWVLDGAQVTWGLKEAFVGLQ